MSLGVFLACVIVMALALSAYAWLAILVARASTVPRRAKWGVLVPPVALWLAVRAGGWPRAAAIVVLLLSGTYVVLRLS
ncbi:MAG: hypothetical protein OHK0013_35520 [Sandaracinaceae bacterium]